MLRFVSFLVTLLFVTPVWALDIKAGAKTVFSSSCTDSYSVPAVAQALS